LTQKGSAHLSSILPFSGTIKFTGLKLARILEDAGAIVKSFSDREKVCS